MSTTDRCDKIFRESGIRDPLFGAIDDVMPTIGSFDGTSAYSGHIRARKSLPVEGSGLGIVLGIDLDIGLEMG